MEPPVVSLLQKHKEEVFDGTFNDAFPFWQVCFVDARMPFNFQDFFVKFPSLVSGPCLLRRSLIKLRCGRTSLTFASWW